MNIPKKILIKSSPLKLFIILFILFYNWNLFSQKQSSPLDPGSVPSREEIGIFIGFGQNIQSGEFNVKCDCPWFDNGIITGSSIGFIVFDKAFSNHLNWGVGLSYDNRSVTASYQIKEADTVTSQISNFTEIVPILYRHKAEATFNHITAMPYLKWNPIKSLFLRVGADLALVVSNHIKHSKEILEPTIILNNGEIASVSFDGLPSNQRAKTLEDDNFSNVSSFQVALNAALGVNIRLSRFLTMSPIFNYSVPLTNELSIGNNFKLSAWRLLLEFRLALKTGEAQY